MAGEVPFYIFCSVENLDFIGDYAPTHDNYALFDWVEYDPNYEPQIPSAVTDIEAPLPSSPIYNLQGIEVTNPQPGHIYITNGKKVRY